MRAQVLVVAFLLGAGVGLPNGAAAAGPGDPVVTGGKRGTVKTVITNPGAPGSSTGGVPAKKTGTTGGGGVAPPVVRFDDGSYSVGGDVGVGCFIERAPELDQPGPPVREAYRRSCDEGTLAAGTGQIIYRGAGSPPPVQVTPAQLAQQAVGELQLPDPVASLSPDPATHPYQLVQLPTWFAVDDWAPRTQRTELGPVFAEVTARPVSTVFDGGDGSEAARCPRQGVQWQASLPEDYAASCQFTYRRATERTTATISIVWEITWTGSGGTGGVLPDIVTSSSQDLTVYERQVLVTYGRG